MMLGLVTKEPAEVFPVTVDFGPELEAGETITAAQVTAKDRQTLIDTTAAIVTGDLATISGSQVAQRIHAGLSGEHHILQYRITTSLFNTFEAEVALDVIEE